MIGIDTNILLRLWLDDEPAQNKRIDTLLAAHGGGPASLLVTDVVLAEAVWTLKSAFEQDEHAQSLAVRSLLDETAFESRVARPLPKHSACLKQAPAGSPTAWSSRSMSDGVATSLRPSIEACASCRESRWRCRIESRATRIRSFRHSIRNTCSTSSSATGSRT